MIVLLTRTSRLCSNETVCEVVAPDVEIRKRFNIKPQLFREPDEWICTIEIKDLDDLREFKKQIGEELILTEDFMTGTPTIEIYDTWRE